MLPTPLEKTAPTIWPREELDDEDIGGVGGGVVTTVGGVEGGDGGVEEDGGEEGEVEGGGDVEGGRGEVGGEGGIGLPPPAAPPPGGGVSILKAMAPPFAVE